MRRTSPARSQPLRARTRLKIRKLAGEGLKRGALRLEPLEDRRLLAAGALDPTFGAGGLVTTDLGLVLENSADVGRAAVLQPDGKVIIVGEVLEQFAGPIGFGVARINSDGSSDSTFGTDGQVFTANAGAARGVALQSDGKIVVAGTIFNGGDFDISIARYSVDGTLDATFAGDGLLTMDFGSDDIASAVVVQQDGRIVVGGESDGAMASARFLTNGDLDTSFGVGGRQLVALGDASLARAMALDANDKIVLAGQATFGGSSDFAVARLSANGILEFERTVTFAGASDGDAFGVAIQTDGRIVLGGQTFNGSNTNYSFARILPNGDIDGTYGVDGRARRDHGANEGARGLALQTDGTIVAVGVSPYYPLLSVDQFGGFNGAYGLGSNSELTSVVALPEGRFTVVGGVDWTTGDANFAASRYTSINSQDYSFGQSGRIELNFAQTSISAQVRVGQLSIQQPSGKLVVSESGPLGYTLTRFNVDGTVDTEFGMNGRYFPAYGRALGFVQQANGQFVLVDSRMGWHELRYFSVDGDDEYQPGSRIGPQFSLKDLSIAAQLDGSIVATGTIFNGIGYELVAMRYLADGELDNTFGFNGIATIELPGIGGRARDIALQADGKILITATVGHAGGASRTLVRLNSSGSLDPTFDGDGLLTTTLLSGADEGLGVAIQPDGKIVSVGRSPVVNDLVVARFLADGALDLNFGVAGYSALGFGSNQEFGRDVMLQPDGKLIVLGSVDLGNSPEFAAVRLTADGHLDASFNGSGRLATPFPNRSADAWAGVVQADGQIVLVGSVQHDTGSSDIAAVRYTSTGSLDNSFGVEGRVDAPARTAAHYIGYAVSVQQLDGKILTAGHATASVGSSIAITRHNADGTLDLTFGDRGRAVVPGSVAQGIAVQPDGKIVLAGSVSRPGHNNMAFLVVRLHANGSLDSTFDGDGMVVTDFLGFVSESANGVAIQPDGRIVVTGYAISSDSVSFAAARYLPSGSLDTSFNGSGLQTIAFGTPAYAYGVALQADGKVVMAGVAVNGTLAVARLMPDGGLDSGFGVSGMLRATAPGYGGSGAYGVAIQPDGRILLVGIAADNSDSDFLLARLLNDGSPDESFDGDGFATVDFGVREYSRALALHSDGRIVVAGRSQSLAEGGVQLARFNPDGSLDDSFDGDGRVVTSLPNYLQGEVSGVAIHTDGRIVVAGFLYDSNATFALLRYDGGVFNSPPTATPGGPYTLHEGETVTLDGSGSSDVDQPASTLTFEWDLDYDGETFQVDAVGMQPTVSVLDDFAERTIAIRVTDSSGAVSIATTTIVVSNRAPVVAAFQLSAATIDENGEVIVTGSYTDAGPLDTHTVEIAWGDGSTSLATVDLLTRSFAASHTYRDDGAYTLTATVTDDDGGTGLATTAIAVQNVAPSFATIDLSAASIDENSSVTVSGYYADAGSLDTHTVEIAWGDGSVSVAMIDAFSRTYRASHTYFDDGDYTITATVTDEAGADGTATVDLAVLNVAPTIADIFPGGFTVYENGFVAVTGHYSDAGTLDAHTVEIAWGDGSSSLAIVDPLNLSFTANHTYLDDGEYWITATVTDDDGAAGDDSVFLPVQNAAPLITRFDVDAATIDENGLATITGTYIDAGTLDTHLVSIDWGDGSSVLATIDPVARTFTASNTYLDDGEYPITATISDDDGATNSAFAFVTVRNVAPVLTAFNLSSAIDENDVATVTGSYTDAGAADSHQVEINWGDGTTSLAPIDPVARTFTASHPYLDDGEFTITVAVADNSSASATATAALVVQNVAPTLTLTGAAQSDEGALYSLTLGPVVDPGDDTVSFYHVGWGDGQSAWIAAADLPVDRVLTHVYADGPADRTIVVHLEDEDGLFMEVATHTVQIDNVAPSVAADASSATGGSDGAASNTGTFSDPGDDVIALSASIGSVAQSAPGVWIWTLGPGAQPSQTVTITADDGEGGQSQTTFSYVRGNSAPVLTSLTAPGWSDSGKQGTPIALSATFSDADLGQAHTATVNWGDGSPVEALSVSPIAGGGQLAGAHAYAAGGQYTVSVTLTDAAGAVVTANTTTVIAGAGLRSDGTLELIGTTGSDAAYVYRLLGQIVVEATFLPLAPGRQVGVSTFPLASVARITGQLREGDDALTIAANVTAPATIHGGAGNDALTAGGGDSVLFGGAGNDRLTSTDGSTALVGGVGNDYLTGQGGRDLLLGGQGADLLLGGAGDDLLVGGTTSMDDDEALLRATLTAWKAPSAYLARVAAVDALFDAYEDSAIDTLTGEDGRDLFYVGQNDRLTDRKATGLDFEGALANL